MYRFSGTRLPLETIMTDALPQHETGITDMLSSLESRAAALRTELATVEARLRDLRTAERVCPACAGTGRRPIRGGLYGERQTARCHCLH